jgi:hypothetical protein
LWNKTLLSITPYYNYVIQYFSIYGGIVAFTRLYAFVTDTSITTGTIVVVVHAYLMVLMVVDCVLWNAHCCAGGIRGSHLPTLQ